LSFKDLVEDKKVLIIGPAPYLYDKSVIEKIENFDTIVRLNRSIEIIDENSKYVGKKVDILYHNVEVAPHHGSNDYSLEEWKKKNVKHVRICYPPIKSYYAQNIDRFIHKNTPEVIESSIVDTDVYNNIFRGCKNTSPNSGTIAIIDLLSYNPKNLHISGLTFLRGKKVYVDGYRDVTNGEELIRKQNSIYKNHSIDYQIEFLKEELNKYKNVSFDDEVYEALYK